MTPLEALERLLRAHKISPDTIDRVLRLNAAYDYAEGVRVRGIHYSKTDDPRLWGDWETKGGFIRRYGREAWDRLDPTRIRKQGRRKYVPKVAPWEVSGE
jgi:hypothetical protein